MTKSNNPLWAFVLGLAACGETELETGLTAKSGKQDSLRPTSMNGER
jgi:hypothetical protein